jgi:hypothetical protein
VNGSDSGLCLMAEIVISGAEPWFCYSEYYLIDNFHTLTDSRKRP